MNQRKRKDYDWNLIKSDYITSNLSYKKLCLKYNIPRTTLQHHALKEKWYDQKCEYREETETKTINAIQSKQVRRLSRLMDVSDALDQALEEMGDAGILKGSASDIRSYAAALKDAIAIKRNLYDIPTLNEIQNREMAMEKLKIEWEKLHQTQTDTSVEVKISEDLEEYGD